MESDDISARMRGARVGAHDGLARRLAMELTLSRLQCGPAPFVGRYEVRDHVGGGAMGTVYRAWDPMLDREVAIKVLRAHSANAEIQAEARMLARLVHPNVLTVFDMGVRDEQLWLAMELVREGNLRDWVSKRRPHWREVARRFAEAARGLAAAHSSGIIHRDVKPENLLLGDDGRTRVADFGLAVTAADASVPVAGTPSYVPPEVLAGGAPTPLGDQYALCVTFAELLLSSDPTSAPPAELLAAAERGRGAQPDSRWPSLDALAEVLERLVARPTPNQRRRLLLGRVQSLWIDGVLRTSLRGGPLLDIELEPADDLIDSAFVASGVSSVWATSVLGLNGAIDRAQRALLLCGGAGAGKTTALLLLARDLLRVANDDGEAPAPVVLHLGSFHGGTSTLSQWLTEELVTKYGLSVPFVQALLEAPQDLVLLLDGLDEVASDQRVACVDAINQLRRDTGIGLVVACRDEVLATLPNRLKLGAALRLRPIDASPAHSSKRIGADDDPLWRTPLMLTLATETAPDDQIDIDHLLSGYVRRALSRGPSSAQARERLARQVSWLAATLRRTDSHDVWLERIQASWLARAWQRWLLRAVGVSVLLGVLLFWNTLAAWVLERPLFMGPILGAPAIIPVLWFGGGTAIVPRGALRWSSRAAARGALITIPISLVCGFLAGLQFKMLPSLLMAVASGVVCAPIMGFVPRDAASPATPGEGLRQSVRTALMVAIPSGLFVGVVMGYGVVPLLKMHEGLGVLLRTLPTIERVLAVQFATVVVVGTALVYGGSAVIQHGLLRAALAVFTPLPLGLTRFFNTVADRGLLRRVGGGWMFQHKLLRDHLAERAQRASK